jgi:hypothetical protein
MDTQKRKILVLVLVGSLMVVSIVLAAPAAIDLGRTVIGGGGGHSEAGIYSLDGTIGQAVVGKQNNAPFHLCSGFWCGLGTTAQNIYLPLVQKP